MIATNPVRYRPMTADEVLTELRAFCQYEFGFDNSTVERVIRTDSTLGELVAALHHDEDLSDLEPYFQVKLSREWWAQWNPGHTVGEMCANLATGTLVPVIEPVTVLGTRCETAGAFLTLRQMLADAGADVRELAPSSEVLSYLRAQPDVFGRFRLATGGRLLPFGPFASWSCLVGGLLFVAGVVLFWMTPWLLALGGVLIAFGLSRPARYRLDGITTFRALIHAALGRPARATA